ncbi:MAG: glutamyl-tRNA reductase [Anaerotignaceae bacterium]
MYVISISHKTAPIDIRKLFALTQDEQIDFIHSAITQPSVTQCLVLNTCNRLEIYFDGTTNATATIESFLSSYKNISPQTAIKYYRNFEGEKAIAHLFKVTAGIDSMLMGEDEILGQVKAAYALALKEGTTGFALNTIFKQAITAAKRIKTQTGLSKTPISIGTLVANLVFDIKKEEKTVLVIGASGKTGTIVAKNLLAKPNIKVLGTLRTHKPQDTLEAFYENLAYVNYKDRYRLIDEADVVVSATTSPHHTITLEEYNNALTTHKPRLFIDLAVPPDIDKRLENEENVTLYNIDYFETLSKSNNLLKKQEAETATEALNSFVDDTLKELSFHAFLPQLDNLKKYFNANSIESTVYKLRKLSNNEELTAVISAFSKIMESSDS